MRLRALAAVLALTAGAAGLSGGTAEAAYTPLTPSITCDAAAGTVTAAARGGAVGAYRLVLVEFRVLSGTSVPTGSTTARAIPQVGTTVTVPTRTNADGAVAVTGYARPWTAADHAFYTERVRVRITTTSGSELAWSGDVSCTRDTRAAATLTCDPVAGTVTAGAAATRGYAPAGRTRLEYRVLRTTTQTAPGEPRWSSGPAGYPAIPDVTHSVTADAAGAWSDTGYVHQRPGYYFVQEVVEVLGFDQTGLVVLRGDLTCSYTTA